MPRDGLAEAGEHDAARDPLTALPNWVKGEKRLSSMLPYVSLVTDRTVRTRGNELMQCIRLEGVNSMTSEDAHLDRIGGLFAGIVAQVGTEFSFYLHKVSKAVDVTLPPVPGEGFAAAVDQRWRTHLGRAALRDKTLTLAEAAARAERIASPMIAFSGTGGGAGRENALEAAALSVDEAFVRAGAQPAPVTRAEVIVNPSNTVIQGTMIQAVTETALDSTLPGAIRAIVSEDVHSFDGSRVLIPRGARLIGRYRSDVALAQSRVMVAWDRIILPDNQTVEISAFGGDELGRTGTTGFVDTRFAQRFGSAALISLIGALPAVAAGQIEDRHTAGATRDVSSDLRDVTQGTLQDYLSIRPVIHVDQGTRITVMVDRDLEIF
jgi:type IV secretory pathway VirB10-like protein